MPDPIDDLENFPTMDISHLPAAEVRRRGDGLRRRRQAWSSVAAAAAVAVIATTGAVLATGGDDNANTDPVTGPTRTVSKTADTVFLPLTEASLLSNTDVTRDGILPWMAGETIAGKVEEVANSCQESSFAELSAREVLQRTWWVETHSLSQLVADFTSAAKAKAAYEEVRGWIEACDRPNVLGYQVAPIDLAVSNADESSVTDASWTDPEVEEGGESFADQREITGLVLADNRLTMITHHMPSADYGWRYTPVEALLPTAAELLTDEDGVPGTDSGGGDPLAQYVLPEPPGSARIGQGVVPDLELARDSPTPVATAARSSSRRRISTASTGPSSAAPRWSPSPPSRAAGS